MPISNDSLLREAAAFKRDASRELDKAVKALIDLAWEKGDPSPNFLWESRPELDAEANAILRELSDNLAALAKSRAAAIIRASLEFYIFDDEWEGTTEKDGQTLLFRLDMEGSHLKELMEIWIALAAVHMIGKSALRVMVSRYMNNPFTSPLWNGIPLSALRWGKGYSKNILEQLAIIGQNAIMGSARLAEWKEEMEAGATYYVRRRGSSYDCDVCEDMANKPIPISVPFEVPHSRCCCYPEYFYGPIV